MQPPHDPNQPQHYVHQNHAHEHDGSKKFMHIGIGLFATILTVCIGGPVVFCVFAMVLGAFNSAAGQR